MISALLMLEKYMGKEGQSTNYIQRRVNLMAGANRQAAHAGISTISSLIA